MKTKKYYFTCYNAEGRKHGAWSMEHGAWSMEHGAWSMEHGVYKWYQGGTLYMECIYENGKIVGKCKIYSLP